MGVHTRGGGELASRLPLGAGPAGAAGTARGGRPSPKRGGVEGRGDETYHDWGNHENGRSEKGEEASSVEDRRPAAETQETQNTQSA